MGRRKRLHNGNKSPETTEEAKSGWRKRLRNGK
jgi:hypothetical protein